MASGVEQLAHPAAHHLRRLGKEGKGIGVHRAGLLGRPEPPISMGLGSVTFSGRPIRSLAARNSLRAGEERSLILSVTAKGTCTSIASPGRLPRKRTV